MTVLRMLARLGTAALVATVALTFTACGDSGPSMVEVSTAQGMTLSCPSDLIEVHHADYGSGYATVEEAVVEGQAMLGMPEQEFIPENQTADTATFVFVTPDGFVQARIRIAALPSGWVPGSGEKCAQLSV